MFSFKLRGAYNKMAHLTPQELKRGVVACSAGNHAQGVAKSAQMLKCSAVIVMPLATPSIKINSVRMHGGPTVEVRLFGNNYDEAAAEAKRLEREENMIMVHPFNDPYVIAGRKFVFCCVLVNILLATHFETKSLLLFLTLRGYNWDGNFKVHG